LYLPSNTPLYARAWPYAIPQAEARLGLRYDQHFSHADLKKALVKNLLHRRLQENSHAPLILDLKSFLHQHNRSPPLPPYLRLDPLPVVAIRARIRMNRTSLQCHQVYDDFAVDTVCPYCRSLPSFASSPQSAPQESLVHVLFDCPHYSHQRSIFLSHLPPSYRSLDPQHRAIILRSVLDYHSVDWSQLPLHFRSFVNSFLLSVSLSRDTPL
jgi:hypothetical protein